MENENEILGSYYSQVLKWRWGKGKKLMSMTNILLVYFIQRITLFNV